MPSPLTRTLCRKTSVRGGHRWQHDNGTRCRPPQLDLNQCQLRQARIRNGWFGTRARHRPSHLRGDQPRLIRDAETVATIARHKRAVGSRSNLDLGAVAVRSGRGDIVPLDGELGTGLCPGMHGFRRRVAWIAHLQLQERACPGLRHLVSIKATGGIAG